MPASASLDAPTIGWAATLIESKKLSPVELTESLLARIERFNPGLDAFVTLTADLALKQARMAEAEIGAGGYRGPMHGIPFGLKDVFNTAGIPTTAQSKTLIGNVPDADATATARLYEAGGVLIGKLATHEFAQGGPSFDLPWPPARNPWNRAHFTGGSSSGSGAAVAAGFVLGAMGTDTGGSVRSPAALCGLVGLKPTYGRISRYGVIPHSYSLDACGPLTRTVEDCAIMLQVLAGHDPKDPASADRPVPDYLSGLESGIRGIRIGVVRHFWEYDLPAGDEVRGAMERALEVMADLGAVLEDVRMRPIGEYTDVRIVIGEPELFQVCERDLRERPGDFGFDFLGKCLPACLMGASDYVQAQRERRMMVEDMEPLYRNHDILLTAGPYGPAPRLDAHRTIRFWQRPLITTPFSVTAGPALVQCMGFSDGGLPLSLQLAGRPFDESTVLRVARAYEKAVPWHRRCPSLDPSAKGAEDKQPRRPSPDKAGIDARARDRVAVAAGRAGLTLSEDQFEQLCAAAPYAEAMTGRLRGQRCPGREPANVFRFPPPRGSGG